jgi:hypothetical protein
VDVEVDFVNKHLSSPFKQERPGKTGPLKSVNLTDYADVSATTSSATTG